MSKYYCLTINGKMIRTYNIMQDEYDVDMFVRFTNDVNLAMKVTSEEVLNNEGICKEVSIFLSDFSTIVNGSKTEKVMDWDFYEVQEIL